jgi:Protein of unknown function (DUF2934)
MAERLVDVSNDRKTVLHTFPITVGDPDCRANDDDYEDRALKAAAHAQLVPDADLKNLEAEMHVSRSGAVTPYGDERSILTETKQGLEQVVRDRAYYLWQKDGCPEGQADDIWNRAREQHFRERAYVLWQQEGSPEGRASEYWCRTQEFEAN